MAAGRITIHVYGTHGGPKKLSVSALDTADAVERCLRNLFQVPPGASLVLKDAAGCARPLGPGLAEASAFDLPVPPQSTKELPVIAEISSDDTETLRAETTPTYRLEILTQHQQQMQRDSLQRASSHHLLGGRMSHLPESTVSARLGSLAVADGPWGGSFGTKSRLPQTVSECYAGSVPISACDECSLWCDLATGFSNSRPVEQAITTDESLVLAGSLAPDAYNTSPQFIDTLYDTWSGYQHELPIDCLVACLRDEFGITLNEVQASEVLDRVRRGLRGGDESEHGVMIPRMLFHSLWQKLMLGAACRYARDVGGYDLRCADIWMLEYNKRTISKEPVCEEDLFFRKSRVQKKHHGEAVARWVRIDSAGPARLVRMGVKFFLHPRATEDAVRASMTGTTNMIRFRHQYLVSLEVYALTKNARFDPGQMPPPTGEHVARSSMFLVATGSPPTGYRDWLLSIVNTEGHRDDLADPLDFFPSDPAAAIGVLDSVSQDLHSQTSVREYMADFLLYTVIDSAVRKVAPICASYGHRLRWLQGQLDTYRLSVPSMLVREVSQAQLQLLELRQWVGQVKTILNQLKSDCMDTREGESSAETLWNFGRWAEGAGRSLMIFLSSTEDRIEHISDRIRVLQELAQSFDEDYQRHRDAFMNQTLLVLTVATAVFMPSQFLAGVYGTNFQREDGSPASPELRWEHGYLVFWLFAGGLIIGGSCLAFLCLCRPHRKARAMRWPELSRVNLKSPGESQVAPLNGGESTSISESSLSTVSPSWKGT